MNYVDPKMGSLSETYNDVSYDVDYYKPATTITGVIDEAYQNWDGVISFNVNDYCIVPNLKKIYRSTLATNSSYPPANLDKWIDYGIVNSYAMFASDENIGSKTKGVDIVLNFDFSRCDTIGFIDIDFVNLKIELLDGTGAVDETYDISGSDYGALSFADYYYTDKKQKLRVIQTGIKWLPSSTLRVTFTGGVPISIGTVVFGKSEELGVTLYGTKLSFTSTSKFKTNPFTKFRTIIRNGKFRTLDVKVIFDTSDFDVLAQKIEKAIDKNMLWIPMKNDKFSESITIAYLENFDIPIDNSSTMTTNSTLVGVSK